MKDRYDIKSEEIVGYRVSEARKKLWVTELDLLEDMEKVCKENDINFFLLFGSAIGAVRHQGFIPWDDDIDMGMLREDFEKFLTVCEGAFPEYVDIQYGLSEHGVDYHLRIRDSRTTGIIFDEVDMPGNKGAFIEIYVFDYVNDNFLRKMQIFASRLLCNFMYVYTHGSKNGSKADKVKIALTKMLTPERLWKWYRKVCMLQNKNKANCEFADTITLPRYARTGNHLFKKEDLQESIYVPYEYTQARIPKGYDHCLTVRYGNYMELPPLEQRGAHHDTIVFYDPDKSYKEYENSEVIKKFFAGDHKVGLL